MSLQPDPSRILSWQTQLQSLEEIVPTVFPSWKARLDSNAQVMREQPLSSLSLPGHAAATKFRAFLAPFLSGTVLDVGCGPQGKPLYLHGYPNERIAGLDPLPPRTAHPFAFVRGCAEFLPWDEGTFDTVVCATSLDHVLLLKATLAGIRRVLKPGGVLVTWATYFPGFPAYDPHTWTGSPADEYHVFHLDKPWFEALCNTHFIKLAEQHEDEPYSSDFVAWRVR